jgi:hypothetical protein
MPLSRRSVSLFVACGLFTTALLIGCSAGTGDVSGKVTFKGAILKGGNIAFITAEGDGPTFAGGILEDGTYKIPGVREGKYKVTVDTESLKPNFNTGTVTQNSSKSGGSKGYGAPGGKGAGDPLKDTKFKEPPADAQMPEGMHPSGLAIIQANIAKYVQIPSRYAKPTSTSLTYTATKGPQTYDIELVE